MDTKNTQAAFENSDSALSYHQTANTLIKKFQIVDYSGEIYECLRKHHAEINTLQLLLRCAGLLWQCGQTYNLFYSKEIARDNDSAFKAIIWLIAQAHDGQRLAALELLLKKLQNKQEAIHALWTHKTLRDSIFNKEKNYVIEKLIQYYIKPDQMLTFPKQAERFRNVFDHVGLNVTLEPTFVTILDTIDYFTYYRLEEIVGSISAQKYFTFDNKQKIVSWCIEQTQNRTKFFKLSSVIEESYWSHSTHKIHPIDILMTYDKQWDQERFDEYLELLLEIRLFNEVANINHPTADIVGTVNITWLQVKLLGEFASKKHNLLHLKELIIEGKRLFNNLRNQADNTNELCKRDSLMHYINILIECDPQVTEKSMSAMLDLIKGLQASEYSNDLGATKSIKIIDLILGKACLADLPTLMFQSQLLKTLSEKRMNNTHSLVLFFHTKSMLNDISHLVTTVDCKRQLSHAEHWLTQKENASGLNFGRFKNELRNLLGFQNSDVSFMDRIIALYQNQKNDWPMEGKLFANQMNEIVRNILAVNNQSQTQFFDDRKAAEHFLKC